MKIFHNVEVSMRQKRSRNPRLDRHYSSVLEEDKSVSRIYIYIPNKEWSRMDVKQEDKLVVKDMRRFIVSC